MKDVTSVAKERAEQSAMDTDADSDPTMKVVITKLLNSRTLFIIELKLGVVNMFCLCKKKLFLEVHYAFQLDEGHDDQFAER